MFKIFLDYIFVSILCILPVQGRARLSIKRRPPSRKHRKSSAEEGEEVAATPNGHEGDVFEEQKASDLVDTTSVSSKQQTEQETESADAENQHAKDAEPENEVETAENKDGGEQEHKTEEVEEKSGGEPQLAGSSQESKTQDEACEEPVTQAHEKPQTEPESTRDEKETEQKEEAEINH